MESTIIASAHQKTSAADPKLQTGVTYTLNPKLQIGVTWSVQLSHAPTTETESYCLDPRGGPTLQGGGIQYVLVLDAAALIFGLGRMRR
jgi:hypothetical protein